jgi:hypothetical protein
VNWDISHLTVLPIEPDPPIRITIIVDTYQDYLNNVAPLALLLLLRPWHLLWCIYAIVIAVLFGPESAPSHQVEGVLTIFVTIWMHNINRHFDINLAILTAPMMRTLILLVLHLLLDLVGLYRRILWRGLRHGHDLLLDILL